MATSKRSLYWDNMKGFLILLVVFGHFLWGFQNLKWIRLLVVAIYMFHMPAFTFISGYFSKNSHQTRWRDSALKLITAYFLFNGLFLIYSFVSGKELYITKPYYSYWYILALIVWRSTVALIDRGKYTLPLLFAAAVLAGFWSDINNTFALSRTITFYPFFYMGYKFSEKSAFKFTQMGIKRKLFALMPLVLAAVIAEAVCYKYFQMTEDVLLMHAYRSGSDILARTGIFLISCIAIMGLLYGTVDKKLPLLTTAGRNSLAVYLIHRPVTFLFQHVVVKYFGERIASLWLWLIAAAFACTIALTAICSRDIFSKFMDDFLKDAVERISKDTVMPKRRLLPKIVCAAMAVIIAAIPVVKMFMNSGSNLIMPLRFFSRGILYCLKIK